MRHTYASFALDAGVTIFELARLMGASVKAIDDTYGHLVHGSLNRVCTALEERARREAACAPERATAVSHGLLSRKTTPAFVISWRVRLRTELHSTCGLCGRRLISVMTECAQPSLGPRACSAGALRDGGRRA